MLGALALGASLPGCGSAAVQLRAGPLSPGRIDGAPSMTCLPDPDVLDASFTPQMRLALQLAEESFSVAPPPPPASHAALALEDWSSGPFRIWLHNKTHAIDQARHELDAAAEQDQRQRIVGGAVVGLMYEDVARVLAGVPAPSDLDDEPEILLIYGQALRHQTQPFLETSRRAYRACARNALSPSTMRHWAHFCGGRADALPEEPIEAPRGGESELEVILE